MEICTIEECCGVAVQDYILRSVAYELRTRSEIAHLGQLYDTLRTMLNFVSYTHIFAWELLAQTAGKLAVAKYNEQLLEKKLLVQELNQAGRLLENFYQASWYDLAKQKGRSAVETPIEDVRERVRDALEIYKVVQEAADRLVYGEDVAYRLMPKVRSYKPAPEVVLVVNVVGNWASVGITTFWSILRYRSTALRTFIFGDRSGIRDWRQMMKTISLAVPHVLDQARFDYIDIFEHPKMNSYFKRLASGCAESNMSKALYARMLCHELLPLDVKRAIALDLGDILVFQDILELWQEGDHLEASELLAAASHRSYEESQRQSKPSMLNGGVVLYEVEKMRRAGYTEDTLRAAELGLSKGYGHFCVWDQDIINVMHQELWQQQRVRILPCRWSIFPVANWQFFWNAPSFWLPELIDLRRYPGLLAADELIHFCPSATEMMHTVFAFQSKRDKKLARDVALAQGVRNAQPNSFIKAPDGTTCRCGEPAALLHVPSTQKLWPWVQWLFRFHRPSFLPPADDAFYARSEQSEDLGGGFWGSEDQKDLDQMMTGTFAWAKTSGASVVSGHCATMPTVDGHYTHVQVPVPTRSFRVTAETNATVDAHMFFGHIMTIGNELYSVGLELAIDAYNKSSTLLRWGMQGPELGSYMGPVLENEGWSEIWVDVSMEKAPWSHSEVDFEVAADLFFLHVVPSSDAGMF